MTKNALTLAFDPRNQPAAQRIGDRLQAAGIQTRAISASSGGFDSAFAEALRNSDAPVTVLLSDNLLKNVSAMNGFLEATRYLTQSGRWLGVLIEGVDPDTGAAKLTEIDRMANLLHYLNYWQNAWLDLSARRQDADETIQAAIEPELSATRLIADQIGDLIGLLKEVNCIREPELYANNFAILADRFGLVPQQTTPLQAPDSPFTAIPTPTSALTPDSLPETPDFSDEETVLPATEIEPIGTTRETNVMPPDFEAIMRDANFWIQNGRPEQGLEILRLACEEYPDNEDLRDAYHEALNLTQENLESTSDNAPMPPEDSPVSLSASEEAAPVAPPTGGFKESETESYIRLGDEAAEKGDYLFAKICWDRALELKPDYPGLALKMGITTAEHLPQYRETAIHYLKMAREQNPDDPAIPLRIARLMRDYPEEYPEALWHYNLSLQADKYQGEAWLEMAELFDKLDMGEKAAVAYKNAANVDPTLATPARNKYFLGIDEPEPAASEPETKVEAPVDEPQEEEMAPASTPVPQPAPASPSERLVVLITGATSGIGRATAEIFAAHGHRVLLNGRRVDRLREMLSDFNERYPQADIAALPFDVCDRNAVSQAFDNLPENWREIDVLVNNAGLAKGLAPIHEGSLEDWETMIDTNIKGLLYVTRCVAPGMVARRKGHIVNTGSSAGKEVYPQGNVYCATKFAVDALTKAMRYDLYRHNVRVSQVSPGHVEDTEFALNRFDGDAERANIYADFQPLKASDVAEVIYFIVARPPHVNLQDVWMYGTQQASSMLIDRSGR